MSAKVRTHPSAAHVPLRRKVSEWVQQLLSLVRQRSPFAELDRATARRLDLSRTADRAAFRWTYDGPAHTQAYLLPAVLDVLRCGVARGLEPRIFDLGCGNGAVAAALHKAGYLIAGCDPSPEGIDRANRCYPHLDLRLGSDADNLVVAFGRWPFVVCLEVVEHVYDPHRLVRCIHDLLEPGGVAVISTPYHGYWKNLALAFAGRWDRHHEPLDVGGHIKFWAVCSLTELMRRAELRIENVTRVGRVPPLAKSMVVTAHKPAG